jgi:hypothetical protein
MKLFLSVLSCIFALLGLYFVVIANWHISSNMWTLCSCFALLNNCLRE